MNTNILAQATKLVNKQVKQGNYTLAADKAAELLPIADETLHMIEQCNIDGQLDVYAKQMRVIIADLERIALFRKAL